MAVPVSRCQAVSVGAEAVDHTSITHSGCCPPDMRVVSVARAAPDTYGIQLQRGMVSGGGCDDGLDAVADGVCGGGVDRGDRFAVGVAADGGVFDGGEGL